MKRLLVILILTAASSVTWGQSAAAVHPFLDKSNTLLILTDGAAKGLDAYFTHRVLVGVIKHPACYKTEGGTTCPFPYRVKGYETDPIARPFVQTTAGQIGYAFGTLALDTGVAYLFHRSGHHTLEKIALSTGISYSSYGAVHSARTFFTF